AVSLWKGSRTDRGYNDANTESEDTANHRFSHYFRSGAVPFVASSAEGLMQAYVAGIPFFQSSLLGNAVYAVVIFGGYHLLQKNVAYLKTPAVK
ncbi:MAG: hypothetical protein IMF17_06845, partial [Proteobacteria bacterium]|nr:hypothetical protein [Pseudomonadota bacterium]